MKIKCTKQEKRDIIKSFNAWCPFDINCPYAKYGYKCDNCINELVEWAIDGENSN